MLEIIRAFLTENPCYKANLSRADSRYTAFQTNGPKGLMLHSVGCPQPSAQVFVNKWNRADYTDACVHAFIDADTGAVWQTLPWNYRAWHCGGSANNTHIGVEMCESGYVKYLHGAEFGILDRAKAVEDCTRTYNSAVALFAGLCIQFGLDPMKDICSHREGGRRGIASGHVDPEHYWTGLGAPYTMDGFRADVQKRMEETIMLNMTKEELISLMDERIKAAIGKRIETVNDIPSKAVRREIRPLLDMEAINGGTDKATDPDDIRLPYDLVRGLVMAKRYTDHMVEKGGGG